MECEHDFRLGPYWILVARTYEEPTYYPPSTNLNIEHCVKCGVLRLREGARKYIGKNMAGEQLTDVARE